MMNLYLDRNHRRQGKGLRLLRRLLDDARAQGCASAQLEVRAGNAAAQALYRKAGFVALGRRPGFYRDPSEDAVLMGKTL